MRLTPWRKHDVAEFPATGVRTFRDEMDRLFDSFFGISPWTSTIHSSGSGQWNPDLDVSETEKEFVIRAELPGLDPHDVDVRVTGNVLTLSGEKKEEAEDKKDGYYRSERRYGSFLRSLELPADTKPDLVSAEFDKGVLVVKVPKDEKAAPRKIEIKPKTAEKKIDVRPQK